PTYYSSCIYLITYFSPSRLLPISSSGFHPPQTGTITDWTINMHPVTLILKDPPLSLKHPSLILEYPQIPQGLSRKIPLFLLPLRPSPVTHASGVTFLIPFGPCGWLRADPTFVLFL